MWERWLPAWHVYHVGVVVVTAVLLAAMAARTKRVRLGTAAVVTLREVGLPAERWEEFVAWIDTMIHESGAAQLEVNFVHGDALALADQVLLFKRIVRQVALEHGRKTISAYERPSITEVEQETMNPGGSGGSAKAA